MFSADGYEVIWLNANGNVGKGYDIVVRRRGEEIKYVEVKTKTSGDERVIRISGTQWEFARKLFNEGEGGKYTIYIVFNAGTADEEIRWLSNPIKHWKEDQKAKGDHITQLEQQDPFEQDGMSGIGYGSGVKYSH